jgi:hypothetical protein
MHRIDTTNAALDLFGAGKNGFTSGNPATNTPATFLNADWCNSIQEELAALVETKFSLDKANRGQVLAALRSMFMQNDQIIDRSGAAQPLLLDRFDVIHKYKASRATSPTVQIVANTQLVQNGVYKVFGSTSASSSHENFDIGVRPNSTSYASQFLTNFLTMTDPFVSSNAVSYRNGLNSTNSSSDSSKFAFDTYNGTVGSDGVFEMTIFPTQQSQYKKMLLHSGDTSGVAVAVGQWLNTSVAWSTLGTIDFYTNQISAVNPFFVELSIKRVA